MIGCVGTARGGSWGAAAGDAERAGLVPLFEDCWLTRASPAAQVKTQFADKPQVYMEFLNIMKDFKAHKCVA